MSKAITLSQKQQIKKQSELGCKSTKIAKELGLSVSTVRKWLSRIKRGSLCIHNLVAL